MNSARKQVVWLYYGEHLNQPFIRLGVETLRSAGYTITVCDVTTNWQKAGEYEHLMRYKPEWLPEKTWLDRRKRDWAVFEMLLRMARWAILRRPEWIVVTMPQVLAPAWLAGKLTGAKLIYYPFELYGEQSTEAPAFWKDVEKLFLKLGLDALVTQNEERARVYVQERGARVTPTIVHNYKRKQTVARTDKLRQVLNLPAERKLVLYEGYIMGGRCLEQLGLAMAHLPASVHLVLIGPGLPWWQATVQPLIAPLGLEGRITLLPAVSSAELLEYISGADVGVMIYDGAVRNNYYCEPGKLSDYVLAGIPMVAPDFPTIGPVLRRYDIGRTFADTSPQAIANAIAEVLVRPIDPWRSALTQAQADLVWETQKSNFLRLFS